MNVSPVTKAVLTVAVAITIAAYVVVVDFGISAGRVHHGVRVDGLDLGGLTEAEAEPLLEELGRRMKRSPIVFSVEGFDCRFIPAELGWGPQPHDTFSAALAVGREGGLVKALRDRARAWINGIEVPWADDPDPEKLAAWTAQCRELATAHGMTLDTVELERRVQTAVGTWPREQIMELPVS